MTKKTTFYSDHTTGAFFALAPKDEWCASCVGMLRIADHVAGQTPHEFFPPGALIPPAANAVLAHIDKVAEAAAVVTRMNRAERRRKLTPRDREFVASLH